MDTELENLRKELVTLRKELARARQEISRLMAIETTAREWHTLSLAPIGKYNGPTVLRARDRLYAALEMNGYSESMKDES